MPARQSAAQRKQPAQPAPFDVPLVAEELLWVAQHWRPKGAAESPREWLDTLALLIAGDTRTLTPERLAEGPPLIPRHRYKPEGPELSPREWLNTLTPEQFEVALARICIYCIALPSNATWRYTKAANQEVSRILLGWSAEVDEAYRHTQRRVTPSLPSDDAERVLFQQLGPLTYSVIDTAFSAIKAQITEWYAQRPAHDY